MGWFDKVSIFNLIRGHTENENDQACSFFGTELRVQSFLTGAEVDAEFSADQRVWDRKDRRIIKPAHISTDFQISLTCFPTAMCVWIY